MSAMFTLSLYISAKKLFGPLPDEPLVYGVDKLIGLFSKVAANVKTYVNANKIQSKPAQVNNNVSKVTITKNEVIKTQEVDIVLDKLEISSHISKKRTFDKNTSTVSCEVKKVIEIREPKSPKSLAKKSSSMECNYTLSKLNIAKYDAHSSRKVSPKKIKSCTKASTKKYKLLNMKSRGGGDAVEVHKNCFERKINLSDTKNRIESILKKDTKHQQKLASGIQWNFKKTEKSIKNMNLLSKDCQRRNITRTEGAYTRINTFDDGSQTYVVMKEKMSEKKNTIQRIFVTARNFTTVPFDPVNQELKKR